METLSNYNVSLSWFPEFCWHIALTSLLRHGTCTIAGLLCWAERMCAAVKGTWSKQIEALHPAKSDSNVQHVGGNDLDADWMRLLWQHSFQHPNPQVSAFLMALTRFCHLCS